MIDNAAAGKPVYPAPLVGLISNGEFVGPQEWLGVHLTLPGEWLMLAQNSGTLNSMWIAGIDLGASTDGQRLVQGESRVLTDMPSNWPQWAKGRYDGLWLEHPITTYGPEILAAIDAVLVRPTPPTEIQVMAEALAEQQVEGGE